MAGKLALKRLTLSDLTFFSWHFRQHPAVRQKAINLNANIFIDAIYPALTETEQGRAGRIPLDLSIYGPGLVGELNVQRKIVKGAGYKNWRLNGELVDDSENPDRFNLLSPGDLVIFEFTGDLCPVAAKALFLARAVPEDVALHARLDRVLGAASMIALEQQELTDIIEAAGPPNNYPIHEFMLDEALEDVVQGGSRGAERLLRRRSGNRLSREQLLQAKEKFDEIGRRGEECVSLYLRKLADEGRIYGFEWVSDENAISPFDFRIQPEENEVSTRVLVDVKSTSGPFDRTIHISLNELRVMAGAPERYDLYRVFEITDDTAQLRIASDMKAFAQQVLDVLDNLPFGALADGISLNPAELPFEEAITIELNEDSDDEFQLLPPA
jgi:hypothetical protein